MASALRLHPAEQRWLDAYLSELTRHHPNAVSSMVIYGSRARGDGGEDSDLDVLLVVRNEAVGLKRDLRRIGYRLSSASYAVPSILAYTEGEWEHRRRRPVAVSGSRRTGRREGSVNREAVIGEWRRSQESLGAAETLMRSGYASDAVSRAYYAIMHAARSALFVHGVATASHIATRRMFGTQLVARGEIESGWADELAEGLDERLAAD